MSEYIRLESFPNEIFLEIFEYFSLDELYQSFHGLNQRIHNLLQSILNRTFYLWSINDHQQFEINRYFSPTISSLIINDQSTIDISQYPNLHSLTYVYATEHQLEYFLQRKSSHQSLTYLNITSDDLSRFIQSISSNQFPSLRQCLIRNIDSLQTCPWKITPTTDSINSCNNENFIINILKLSLNLQSLSLSIYEYSLTSSSVFISHLSLKYLSIEIIQPAWTIEIIQTLFSSIDLPHLMSFRMISYETSLIPFDFAQLIEIFQRQLPNLHRFQCDMRFSKGVELVDIKTIKNLHSFLFNHLTIQHQYNETIRIYSDDL